VAYAGRRRLWPGHRSPYSPREPGHKLLASNLQLQLLLLLLLLLLALVQQLWRLCEGGGNRSQQH
jgi:hypothetical protein